MNTQLDMFPEQVIKLPVRQDQRLRVSRGQYCTPEQKQKDEIIRAAMAEETAKRYDDAIWRTLRRNAERILWLENQLQKHNLPIR